VQHIGKYLILAGLIMIVVGALIWFAGHKLHWFGHLPGDVRIDRKNFTFYFPVVSMLILSAVLSLVVWIIRRFL
jgi:hypothetical protein